MSTAPPGCALGLSGPTLNPGDALRNARRSALTQLVSRGANTVVSIESELLVSGGGQRGGEFTRQNISGSVRDAKIVAMWAESVEDEHTQALERHVYAMACERAATATVYTDPTVPAWLLNVPSDTARACALAIGGPTWNPQDQPASALRDGRRALAASLESELEAILIDTGRQTRLATELEATAQAIARAESVSVLDAEWSDRAGTGPLGLEETLYGLVCVSR